MLAKELSRVGRAQLTEVVFLRCIPPLAYIVMPYISPLAVVHLTGVRCIERVLPFGPHHVALLVIEGMQLCAFLLKPLHVDGPIISPSPTRRGVVDDLGVQPLLRRVPHDHRARREPVALLERTDPNQPVRRDPHVLIVAVAAVAAAALAAAVDDRLRPTTTLSAGPTPVDPQAHGRVRVAPAYLL